MAIVNGASNVSPRARGGAGYANPQTLSGSLRVIIGTVANIASDNAGSKYHLCDLPSDCYLDPDTTFDVDNWGFATVRIGTETDGTALLNVARSAAALQRPIADDGARRWQMLWQALGLSANPGGLIGLWAHGPADATGAGSMPFCIEYISRS